MLSVVTWLWGDRYGAEHVLRLRSGLQRNLRLPHRFWCITDRALPTDVDTIPLPDPRGLARARRLQIFDRSIEDLLGSTRILQLDIDCIVVGDVTPLVDRPEPFVIWKTPPAKRYKSRSQILEENPVDVDKGAYNTSMVLRDAGILPTIWADYLEDPSRLEAAAKAAGVWTMIASIYKEKGTGGLPKASVRFIDPGDDDQAIVSLYARPLKPALWSEADGVYKLGRRGFSNPAVLPANARIVFFNGSIKSSHLVLTGEQAPPWIEEHWR